MRGFLASELTVFLLPVLHDGTQAFRPQLAPRGIRKPGRGGLAASGTTNGAGEIGRKGDGKARDSHTPILPIRFQVVYLKLRSAVSYVVPLTNASRTLSR